MSIKVIEIFGRQTLFENLRKVCLHKQPSIFPYENAEFRLDTTIPRYINIPQSYVLESNLKNIWNLWLDLKIQDIDIFSLDGYVKIEVDNGDDVIRRDVLPPIVEVSSADDCSLLNDGMHRIFLSSMFNKTSTINIVLIKNVDSNYPYYALPFKGSFDEVKIIRGETKPDGFDGKVYRLPGDEYKRLFRDFNSAFENVTFSRR